MIINKVLEDIRKNPGEGSSEQDYLILYTIVRTFQVKTIVEIGTHKGASSIAMCQAIIDNLDNPKIWTIDSWRLGYEKQTALDNFNKAGFKDYIEIVEGNSIDIMPKLIEKIGKVDLVFIDGDHSIEMVKQDYDNVKNHTNLILFHDTEDGNISYWKDRKNIKTILDKGWNIISFPTRYSKADNPNVETSHLVGISLAWKEN